MVAGCKLLTHCPCFRPIPDGSAVTNQLPEAWVFRPNLLNCRFEACHGVSLSQQAPRVSESLVVMLFEEAVEPLGGVALLEELHH